MTPIDTLRRGRAVEMLAAELGADPTELDGLAELPVDELAAVRRGLARSLAHQHDDVFAAFAQASGLVPAVLAARITRRAVGPALAGRIAAHMQPDRAAALLDHLDVDFVATACHTVDVEAAARLLPAVSDDVLLGTARQLATHGAHAVLGRFVGVLDDDRLRPVLAALAAGDLLEAGAWVDDASTLDRVVELLPTATRRALLEAAPDHGAAAADLLLRIRPATRGLLLDALVDADDETAAAVLDRLATGLRHDLHLHAAASALPGDELATASRRLDRNETLRRAIGRLVVAAAAGGPRSDG